MLLERVGHWERGAKAGQHALGQGEGGMCSQAQQPGWDTGSSHDWNLIVDCRFLYQVPRPLSESPEVRYQLNGHQSLVGQDEASLPVHAPQWQFSTTSIQHGHGRPEMSALNA